MVLDGTLIPVLIEITECQFALFILMDCHEKREQVFNEHFLVDHAVEKRHSVTVRHLRVCHSNDPVKVPIQNLLLVHQTHRLVPYVDYLLLYEPLFIFRLSDDSHIIESKPAS